MEVTLYDPPSGWQYGFPKPYLPHEGESIEQTLLRDGYPQEELDWGAAKHVRFIGPMNNSDGFRGLDKNALEDK